jgi:hypothetical protein
MALHTRFKTIAAKIEDTKGTAETLTASEAAILAFDPAIDQSIEFENRMPAGFAGGVTTATPGVYGATFTASVELRGSGTAGTLPAWAETLLVACGLKDNGSGVLQPILAMDDQKTVTIAIWEDGRKKQIHGAMGNAVLRGTFGQRTMVEFTFTGIWDSPTDEATPTGITHESTSPLRFAGTTFTFDSYHPKLSEFSFDLGNDVQLRPDVEVDPAGVFSAYIAGRQPTVTLDPEAVKVATHDLYGKWIAGTTVDFALSVGSTTGNIVAVNMDRLQYMSPTNAERNGLKVDQLTAEPRDGGTALDSFDIDFSG